MARAQRDVGSAAAQLETDDLQRRLTQTETRLRQAKNRTVSGRAALQSQHTAKLTVLRKEPVAIAAWLTYIPPNATNMN